VARISLFRQVRDDDELLMRRMESLEQMSEADAYQKLRQIHRDIREGAKVGRGPAVNHAFHPSSIGASTRRSLT
jgi:hypothetical protein